MIYTVVYSKQFVKAMKKLDKQTARIIKNWIVKNLVNCVDPRIVGKPLKGNLKGLWRYRIGDYRLFAEFIDDELLILLIDVGHRSDVYK